jgi:uncharacterized membrane protein YgcG
MSKRSNSYAPNDPTPGKSSEEHFYTTKVYAELDRQDKIAAATGTTPSYQTSGFEWGDSHRMAEETGYRGGNGSSGRGGGNKR